MKNINNIIYSIVFVLALSATIYFLNKESNTPKETIKVINSLYEKQNSNSSSTISGSDNSAVNNQQNNIATNTQEKVATSTKVILENNLNKKMKTAIMKTNMGEIEIELSIDLTPNTAANFAKLASEGFYNGIKFHRVISGFMIQGGDPFTKDNSKKNMWGLGGPGYKFDDEIKSTNKNSIYTISMANSGPNTNGSQFFINTAENNFLDSKHTVFGKVTKGIETITKISATDTDGMDRPLKDVIIESVTMR